jgi:UDP-N-acetylmuramoyl-tripeptide--D-alanyl-D-alanine ligase
MPWTLEQILSATRGKLTAPGRCAALGEVVTDSKKVEANSVFIALKGRKFDGHRFAKDAARRGAGCLIVHKRIPLAQTKNAAVVRVRDTLEALGALGHYRRMELNPKVLAITGSNGKTTTKEMVAAILEKANFNGVRLRGRVLKTEGNYNNLVGLPLTLLRLSERHRAAVVELGTSNPGEIARLTRIAAPDVAIVTSVGPAHLSGLKSVAGVAREKGSIFRGLRGGGVAVVNLDDPWTRRIGAKLKGKKITYGKQGRVGAADARPIGDGGTAFILRVGGKRARIRLRLPGEHNLMNALGAAAMTHAAGVDLRAIRAGLDDVRPFSMRMAVERWNGLGIINDAYNANPASMEAALKTLARIDGRGRKFAVVGDMLELGGETRKRHLAVGRQAAENGIDRLYIFGKQAQLVRRGALAGGMEPSRVTVGKTHARIASQMRKELRAGDWILFKGSRGMKMEKVLGALKTGGA